MRNPQSDFITYALLREATGTLITADLEQLHNAALIGSETSDLTDDVADELDALAESLHRCADAALATDATHTDGCGAASDPRHPTSPPKYNPQTYALLLARAESLSAHGHDVTGVKASGHTRLGLDLSRRRHGCGWRRERRCHRIQHPYKSTRGIACDFD